MGCCCCCLRPRPRVDHQTHSTWQGRVNAEGFSFQRNDHRSAVRSVKAGYTCDVCGIDMDPALLDGHQETCRTNHLRAILAKNAALLSAASIQPSSPRVKYSDDATSRDKEQCVVCMDRPRCYAFLPCGHISCCQECTKSLDQCPLCRQPREGLCQVSPNVTAQYECKHCHELIVPTLFDGHREVCGLRQRQAQREAENAVAEAKAAALAIDATVVNAGNSAGPAHSSLSRRVSTESAHSTVSSPFPGATPPLSKLSTPTPQAATAAPFTSARSLSHLCLECGKTYDQLVLCVPCGHRVLCYTCSKRLTTCPVCVTEIRDTIVAFD